MPCKDIVRQHLQYPLLPLPKSAQQAKHVSARSVIKPNDAGYVDAAVLALVSLLLTGMSDYGNGKGRMGCSSALALLLSGALTAFCMRMGELSSLLHALRMAVPNCTLLRGSILPQLAAPVL